MDGKDTEPGSIIFPSEIWGCYPNYAVPLAMTSMDRTPDCVSFTYEFPHWVKLCPSILFGEGTHFYFEVSADIL